MQNARLKQRFKKTNELSRHFTLLGAWLSELLDCDLPETTTDEEFLAKAKELGGELEILGRQLRNLK